MPIRPAHRNYLQTLRSDAAVERVWQALVQPGVLQRWHAEAAVVEPHEGGRYDYRSRLFGPRTAVIAAFEPGRRLRLVYEPNPHWPPAGGTPIVEDFLIDTRPTGTGAAQSQLRLIGSGVPADPQWDAILRRLQAGWAVAFSYLQRLLDDGDLERRAS